MNTSTIYYYFNIAEIIQEEQNIVNKLIEHAAKIALCSFLHRYKVLLLFHLSFENHLQSFFDSYGKSVFVHNSSKTLNYGTIEQYVILVADVEDLTKKLNWLSENYFYNTGRFIIVCHPEHSEDCDETNILKICWKHKIVNIIYLKSNKNKDDVEYYTFNPYKENNCENSDPILITDRDQNQNKYFPKKTNNLQLCPIIGSTFIQKPFMRLTETGKTYGIDGDVLVIIESALNATLKLITAQQRYAWGSRLDNGTWTGSFGDIYYGNANFSMTSAAVSLTRFENFEMSVGYGSIAMVWITRPDKERPSWQKLLAPFDSNIKLFLGFIFLFIVTANMFFKTNIWGRWRRRLRVDTIRLSLVFYSWMIFVGKPIKIFSTNNKALSLVIITWIWFSFLITTIYQVGLITVLKTKYYYPGVQTLNEAIQAGYLYGGGMSIRYYYFHEPEIFNNWIIVDPDNIPEFLMKLSDGRKFVIPLTEVVVKQFMKDNYGKRLHVLREKLVVFPRVIFFKRYSPFVTPINEILLKLTEGGFIDKIYRDYMPKTIIKEQHYARIKVDDFSCCYILLFIGYLISTIAFLFEIYEHHIENL